MKASKGCISHTRLGWLVELQQMLEDSFFCEIKTWYYIDIIDGDDLTRISIFQFVAMRDHPMETSSREGRRFVIKYNTYKDWPLIY